LDIGAKVCKLIKKNCIYTNGPTPYKGEVKPNFLNFYYTRKKRKILTLETFWFDFLTCFYQKVVREQ